MDRKPGTCLNGRRSTMKREGALRQFLIAFLIAAAGYAVFYTVIENRRTRKGPWLITFGQAAAVPAIIINQPSVGITNVTLVFEGQTAAGSPTPLPINFAEARMVPFEVPYGKVIFLDTTFLPGTVTMQLFGHEIELLPRVMILDHSEHLWRPDDVIRVPKAKSEPTSLTAPSSRGFQ
jgi:hypothetical protein